MVAFCREGGLGDARLDAEAAMRKASELFQPLRRGLVIEVVEKVAEDPGQSALNVITFNVSE